MLTSRATVAGSRGKPVIPSSVFPPHLPSLFFFNPSLNTHKQTHTQDTCPQGAAAQPTFSVKH